MIPGRRAAYPGSSRGRPDPRIGPSLFIAVPLPEPTRAAVAELVRGVRREPDRADDAPRDPNDVRWVRMDGLHLTLRFLGPTPIERIPMLIEIVDALAAERGAFPASLAGTGAFPSEGRPRTLWLGVDDGVASLESLVADLGAALTAAGWAHDDRPFRAHLTLARSDGVRAGPAVVHALAEAASAAGFVAPFRADRIVLFESRTGGGPARYEPLHAARLTGPSDASVAAGSASE